MRNISQETKDSIVNIFPKENTLAIIIFGSFGTDRATYNSDIDIAWIPTKKVPITELAIKTQSLRNVLDINVDLKIVTDNYTVASKVREMFRVLIKQKRFVFNKLFSIKKHNKQEVVTAFSGLLELSRRSKVETIQEELFGDITVEKVKKVAN